MSGLGVFCGYLSICSDPGQSVSGNIVISRVICYTCLPPPPKARFTGKRVNCRCYSQHRYVAVEFASLLDSHTGKLDVPNSHWLKLYKCICNASLQLLQRVFNDCVVIQNRKNLIWFSWRETKLRIYKKRWDVKALHPVGDRPKFPSAGFSSNFAERGQWGRAGKIGMFLRLFRIAPIKAAPMNEKGSL